MKRKKLVTLLLAALLMTLPIGSAFALKDYVDNSMVTLKTGIPNYSGKTIILHSNDVHGAIDGYAYIVWLTDVFRQNGAEVIVADAGDFTQGDIYVSTNKGHVAIEMMNAAGYDVVTLGNHEFDFGYEQLMSNLQDAKFQVICANVYKNDELILPPSTVIETASGLKIGFFGMETPETATKVNPGQIEGIRFSTFEKLSEAAQSSIDDLKAQDVDLVIGLWHMGIDDESAVNGYRSIDLLKKISGVDLVIDAHSHTVMTVGPEQEAIQSTGTRFSHVGVVVIDNETKRIIDNYLIPTAYVKKDAGLAAVASSIMEKIDETYGAPFATAEIRLNGDRAPGNRTEETNLGDLITDAIVWSVVNEGGIEQDKIRSVVGILNGGGIRASLEVGEMSMKDVNKVLPFGNTVSVVYVTGAELLEALEASTFVSPEAIGGFPQTSGIRWTLDTTREYDQGKMYINHDGGESSYYAPASIRRVTIESINGEPFDPEATYAVVTNNFCAAGGDTYNVFMHAWYQGNGFDTGIPLDQAVSNYVTDALSGKIVAETYAEPQGRMNIILP